MSADTIFWLAAIIVCVVVEAVTVGLASIWFAIGGAAALICALLHGPVWLQILWFLVVSLITLMLTRPAVRRFMASRAVATNADRSIGRVGMATQRIDNVRSSGEIKLDGVLWTARSVSDSITIDAGTPVVVRDIQGVKLLVEPKTDI